MPVPDPVADDTGGTVELVSQGGLLGFYGCALLALGIMTAADARGHDYEMCLPALAHQLMDGRGAPEHLVIGVGGDYQQPLNLGHTLSVSRGDTPSHVCSFCASEKCGHSKLMLVAHTFLPDARVELLGEAPPLPPDLEAEVERLWQAERSLQGDSLFNGYTFSAVEVGPARIAGHRIEYRRLIAQRLRPELFEALRVRPVGVSGLLRCADGIVFGRRARSGVQDPGLWELAPSGGVDTTGVVETGPIDIQNQIMTELREEVGLDRNQVTVSAPFCLIEDDEAKTLDVGFALTAPALTAGAILQLHQASGRGEYQKLAVIPQAGLPRFLVRIGAEMVPVSRMLLSFDR